MFFIYFNVLFCISFVGVTGYIRIQISCFPKYDFAKLCQSTDLQSCYVTLKQILLDVFLIIAVLQINGSSSGGVREEYNLEILLVQIDRAFFIMSIPCFGSCLCDQLHFLSTYHALIPRVARSSSRGQTFNCFHILLFVIPRLPVYCL